MHLFRFGYDEHLETSRAWRLHPFTLGRTTLLVGQNATGKTRTINAIRSLARVLYEGTKVTGHFQASFDEDKFEYEFDFSDGRVQREVLTTRPSKDAAKTMLLERDSSGRGWLKGEDLPQLQFGLTETQVAAFTKRDAVQHPYLTILYEWARDIRVYRFGEPMGRTNLVVMIEEQGLPEPDPRDANLVAGLFHYALKKFDGFADAVVEDLNASGYEVTEVVLQKLGKEDLTISAPMPGQVYGLAVQEKGLAGLTSQIEISQGMFRALSTIIHFNLCLRAMPNGTVIMDDIGEGLDFERSSNLINLLMQKAANAQIQLIMSTNDRYVMNAVPLESWAVIVREGSECSVLNYSNARTKFERFAETGLANVDFLRLAYWEGDNDA